MPRLGAGRGSVQPGWSHQQRWGAPESPLEGDSGLLHHSPALNSPWRTCPCLHVGTAPLGGTRGSGGAAAVGAAPTNRVFSRHISPHSTEILPAQPRRGAGRGILPWQDPSGGGGGGLKGSLLFVPPAGGFPSSHSKAMLLAGWVGGGELSLPGEMQQSSGFPQAPSCLELLLQPEGSGVFPAGSELPSQLEFQKPSRAVGNGQGGSCLAPGLFGCILILNPLLSRAPDPTSKARGVCGARGSCRVCSHPGRVA